MTARTFAGLRSVRPRAAPPRLIVLHWTGGVARSSSLDTDGDGIANYLDTDDDGDGLPDREDPDASDAGGLAALYNYLRSRRGPRTPDGISVHVGTAADGIEEVWAPDGLVTLHAGKVNDDSLGDEVVSPGYSHVWQGGRLVVNRAWEKERARGIVREEYEDRIRGRLVRMLSYTDAQTETVARRVERWCDAHGIPRRVPLEADGSLMRRQMSARELAAYSGVIGHYHCHATKCDPGTRPLLDLARRWSIETR